MQHHRERSVIHINVANFAVAVERRLDARLRDRPVLIAPAGAPRTPVYDMSQEAFQSGIRKGMPVASAIKRCRACQLVPLHPARYELAMKTIIKYARKYTPAIEHGDGDGHLFLDVTGTSRLFGPPPDVAWRLEKQVKKDLGMAPVWSVAPNKLVAKVATRLVKPVGEYIVWPGEEAPLLEPLPMHLIPGIEKTDLVELSQYHISRVHQLRGWTMEQLQVPFGARAKFLFEVIRGIDPSPITPGKKKMPAIAMDHEFSEDTNNRHAMEQVLYGLTEKGGKQLRAQRRFAKIAGVVIDYSDGRRCARQISIDPATANDPALFAPARKALRLALTRRVRVKHIRLVLRKLVSPPVQLTLFDNDRQEQQTRLCDAMDRVRLRFGDDAVYPGRMASPQLQEIFYA
ncbi:MAG: hypothetical protein SWH68_12525 [Thermodesulfobacteriota bacterium]|nr:hypothetical protein [Thermodesulfobacteriota bacterium]